MYITLEKSEEKIVLTDDEIAAFVNNFFNYEATKQQASQTPKEGHWFKVNPKTIDQKLFQNQREDEKQEEMRLIILEAFDMLKSNPKKYGRTFETMIPNKLWDEMSVKNLKILARNLGDHIANWVEQAFEWAQRICNGESWEDVCNKKDTALFWRLVVWKDNYTKRVGGSYLSGGYFNNSPSYISEDSYEDTDYVRGNGVPLVVRYK